MMYILVFILFPFVSASYYSCSEHECPNDFMRCEKMEIKDCECNGQSYCVHTTVISDYQSPRRIVFIISLFIMLGFSNLVGMGGETSKVPISMYLMLYNNYEAVIFSYFGTIGSGILNSLYILLKNDNYIDYEIIQVIFPALIVGSEIGNYINRRIPDYIAVLVVTIAQFIVLILFILKTFKIIKKDRKQHNQQLNLIEYLNDYNSIYGDQAEFSEQINYDQSEMKVHTMKFILLVSLVYQTSIILRGGKYFSPFFEFDGTWFRITTALIFAICILAFIFNYIYLNRQDQKNKEEENPSYTLKRRYKLSNYILIWFWSIIGSFLTGFIGIGNGLLVPIFIISKKMKMNPKTAIVTQSITYMLLAISMAIQTFLNPTAKYEDIGFYSIIGILSVIFITLPLNCILNKYSYQNSILAGIIDIILVIDVVFGILYLKLYSNNFNDLLMPDDCCEIK